MGLLSVSIWLPILAGTVLLAMGRDDNAKAVRWLALAAAIASFLVTIPLVSGFDVASAAMQFEEKLPWIERFKVNYHWAWTASPSGSCCSPPSSP
jgi:NADH-quinone oxidoreductase subunit M